MASARRRQLPSGRPLPGPSCSVLVAGFRIRVLGFTDWPNGGYN
ncbi:hypothetical protein [Embleya sp. AB8]